MVLFAEEEAFGQAMSRTEVPLASVLTSYDDGKRYAKVLALVGGNVPLVGIGKVFQHNLGNIEFFAFSTSLLRIELHGEQRYHHQE